MNQKLFDAMVYLYTSSIMNEWKLNKSTTETKKHFKYMKTWIRAHGGDVPVR